MRRACLVLAIPSVILAATDAAPPNGSAAPVARVARLKVDGDVSDWREVSPQVSESEPKATALAQDEANLYAYFSFTDLDLAERILRSGAIVWVNSEGRHEEAYGLRFRGTQKAQKAYEKLRKEQSAADTGDAAAEPDLIPRREVRPASQRQPLGTLEVLRSGAVREVIPGGGSDGGPAAACRVVGGTFTYELRIPLSDIAPPSAAGAAEGAVAVGFQMSGRTRSERRHWAARRAREPAAAATPTPEAAATVTSASGAGGDRPASISAGASGAPHAEDGRRTRSRLTWFDVVLVWEIAARADEAPPGAPPPSDPG